MVKNIDSTKLSNAAGVEAVCKSYSGAKIKEIKEKLRQDYPEGSKKIHRIILHVDTNKLVAEDVSDAAKDMEGLIVEAKKKADNVAVSGVIRRYDQKVTHARIVQFNTKVHELCKKHRITLIENDAINKQNLNRSLLHLNKQGDRLLGGAFCSYLRSIRPNNPGMRENVPTVNFWKTIRPYPRCSIEWMNNLKNVKQLATRV